MTNVITEPLPDPIKVLNAASIQTFLANAEQYELRTGLRLNRHNVGGVEIRKAISLLWAEHFAAYHRAAWDSEELSWRTVLHSLLKKVGTGTQAAHHDALHPFERLAYEWQESWEYNPTQIGQIFMVEANLSLKIDELQLNPNQITRITPDIIKMLRERVTFRELSRLWSIERESGQLSELLRRKFLPAKTKDISLEEWWRELRQQAEDWLRYGNTWRQAAGIPTADSRRLYAAEGAMIRSLMQAGRATNVATSSGSSGRPTQSSQASPHTQGERNDRPAKKARTEPQSQNSQTPATVEPTPKRGNKRLPMCIQHADCRWCKQANYTEPGSHLTNACPRYPQFHGAKPSGSGKTTVNH